MSLAIKNRHQPVNIFQATFIFFASFSFSFVVGSLSFIPQESSAEGYTGIDLTPALAMTINLADFSLPATETFSINEFIEIADNIDIEISTNNSNGFALTMSISNSTTGLTHANGFTTIPSTSNSSAADLDINTWGYNIGSDATTFRRIPGLGSQTILTSTSTPTESSTTTVTVGAKADTTFPSGSYSNTLRFTAVTN
ncbi:hypothetical protein FWF89_01985 [Candidatus Saccharibacteria bacterium]|nr:hypothetical protein [Candidatus Saccharibacteria bacterium]